jgi:RHS repeat-associated protein
MGSAASEIEFHDPLGSWKERYEYDDLNQLQQEEGEFHLTADFDAFGVAKAARRCPMDDDGNVIELEEKEGSVAFEYDALGRLVRVKRGEDEETYRYDGFGRLQQIIQKDGLSKRLCWLDWKELGALQKGVLTELKVPHPVTLEPIAIEVNSTPFHVKTDARGSITALYDISSMAVCEVYRYSAFGALHIYGSSRTDERKTAISPWLYCGKRLLQATYDFGARRYSVTLMRWMERDPLGIVDTLDDRVYVRNNPMAFTDPTGLFPWFIDWSAIGDSILRGLQGIASNTYKTITFSKERLDWLSELRATYEEDAFKVFGRAWLRCSGYNLDPSSSYTYGGEEKNPKVRITLINGILNGIPEARKSAALLSSTHADIPVHFIYAATEGFSGDLLRGAFAKAGVVSRQSKMLAELWRQLIDEMGGVGGEGTILHYAHSLGATETLNALGLLEPEERALIRICTFGSPTLLDDGVCGKVDNYVSVKDGIPILDYGRYSDGAKGIRTNVHFVPSEGALPFVDHYFDGKTYRGVLEMLGQKFQEEFLCKRPTT